MVALEDSLVILQNFKHTVTLWLCNTTLFPQETKNLCLHKNLYNKAHSSAFLIAKKWKQMSTDEGIKTKYGGICIKWKTVQW